MADALAKDYLGSERSPTTLSSIETLRTFKDAVQKDEFAFNFNVMELYLRCIELLRTIQVDCLTVAPLDYPEEIFDKGIGMNTVISELLRDLSGKLRVHGIMFPHAVATLRKVIEKEGSMVLNKARARQDEVKLQQRERKSDIEPSFENPPKDAFSLDMRSIFGRIIIQDENADCRMPFGFG